MTPTALTPAGREARRSTPGSGAPRRQDAAPGGVAAVAQGARTTAQGARATAQGARTAAAGARTAADGARTAVQGARAAAQGTRTMAQGARAAAQGARAAAEGVRGRGAGHRPSVKRPTTPRVPRRVSGPARPGRPRARQQPTVRGPLAARCTAFVRALPDHALLDRLIRGRYWIPLLGILLVGIVAMQVEVLKLNAGVGRALEQTTSLQNRNEQLRAAVAREADDQRIESAAARMGMIMPPPATIRFLQRHSGADLNKAVTNIHAPDPTGFQAALTAAAPATGTTPATSATPATPATSTTSTTSTTQGATSPVVPTSSGTASTGA